MIIGRKRFCDKCGLEIEHNFYHSIEWTDVYVHRLERKHKCAEICNRCYAEAFHTFFQCGEDIVDISDYNRTKEVNTNVPKQFEDLYYKFIKED